MKVKTKLRFRLIFFIYQIGSSPGFEDGEFESAKLARPAASFYHDAEDCLYIVDSEVCIQKLLNCDLSCSEVWCFPHIRCVELDILKCLNGHSLVGASTTI